MFNARLPFTPSTSPPSSPAPCIDSSPPDSPSLDPMILDQTTNDPHRTPHSSQTGPPPQVVDPYAASVKANWTPPLYELRLSGEPKSSKRARVEHPGPTASSPFGTSPASIKKMKYDRRINTGSVNQYHREPKKSNLPASNDDVFGTRNAIQKRSHEEQEAIIWDDACISVFNGNGSIDLSNNNLTHIPSRFIEDLEKMYIPPESLEQFKLTSHSTAFQSLSPRPFARHHTAPADIEDIQSFLSSPNMTSRLVRANGERTRTVADVSLGLPKGEIALYLTANQISKLPIELFVLQKLTILSIRNNCLTYIPPEIVHLTNLHTLNLAFNRLRYLPAEMLEMSLTNLLLHPNPFLEPTALDNHPGASHDGRLVSRVTHVLPRTIPLVELTLRRLLSPAGEREDSIVFTYYETPLREYPAQPSDPPLIPGKRRFRQGLPIHIRSILNICAPGSVYSESEDAVNVIASQEEPITGVGCCAYERYRGKSLYEKPIHNIFVHHAEERFTWETKVANVAVGGIVPMRWRGCSWGCLDFLREKDSRGGSNDVEMTSCEDAVQTVNFVGGELGFDE
ncbi:hypothetical protein AMATHDRAFT_2657 [Amanita thiersii Skay4041]|uniref:Uncharacterized protein n=1 Tax=Amanita thiersii Skay4041 TaxID=703135 RepID=A0A2A9NW68_9AGAR|nr:hypothetical protein AMATHDRAFT_2657 [Amanita thiersii Skay4041]